MTRGDKIRAMDDWELADFFARTQYANAKEILEIFGVDFPFDEESFARSRDELYQMIQKTVGDE